MKAKTLIPLFFCVLFALILLAQTANASIDLGTTYDYTYEPTLPQNHFAITYSYIITAWQTKTSVTFVVLKKGENTIYRSQTFTFSAGSQDSGMYFKMGGLGVWDYGSNIVVLPFMYYYIGNNGENLGYIWFNAQTGDSGVYVVNTLYYARGYTPTPPFKTDDGKMLFLGCYDNDDVDLVTITGKGSHSFERIRYGDSGYRFNYFSVLKSDERNIYYILGNYGGYIRVLKYNYTDDTVTIFMTSGSNTDMNYFAKSMFNYQFMTDTNNNYYLVILKAFYFQSGVTTGVGYYFYRLNITGLRWDYLYLGGTTSINPPDTIKAIYGLGIFSKDLAEVYCVSSDKKIYLIKLTLSGLPTSLNVNVQYVAVPENTLVDANYIYWGYHYFNVFKVEISTSDWKIYYESQGLYAGSFPATYTATLLSPNSTTVIYGQTYLIQIKFKWGDAPYAYQFVKIWFKHPSGITGEVRIQTDDQGILTHYFTFYEFGTYTFVYGCYDVNNVNVWNYTIFWRVVSQGQPSPSPQPEFYIPQIVYTVVPLVFLFVPAILLAGMGLGSAGLMAGLMLGGIALWMSGLLPIWGVFLIALAIIMLIFFGKRGSEP
jgi:hypothetical protein